MAICTGPTTTHNTKEIISKGCNETSMSLDNQQMNKYEVIPERLGDNRNADGDQTEKVFQKESGLNATIDS